MQVPGWSRAAQEMLEREVVFKKGNERLEEWLGSEDRFVTTKKLSIIYDRRRLHSRVNACNVESFLTRAKGITYLSIVGCLASNLDVSSLSHLSSEFLEQNRRLVSRALMPQ
jgi:hypothetical protein